MDTLKRKLNLPPFFRYTVSSLVTSILEEGIYIGLDLLLQSQLTGIALTAAATGVARFLSCLANFYINQHLVFHAKGNTGKALIKYFVMAIPMAIFQFILTFGIYKLFQIRETQTLLRSAIYAGVMVALFFVGYIIQQRWVYASKKK